MPTTYIAGRVIVHTGTVPTDEELAGVPPVAELVVDVPAEDVPAAIVSASVVPKKKLKR